MVRFRFFGLLLVLIGLKLAGASSRSSETIKFENGQYKDILIGIDGDKIPVEKCRNIIQYLNGILPEFSQSLQQATEGKASIGDVNLIIPQNWTAESCGVPIGEAPPHFCYDSSHIQLTNNHPLAVNLPWTRQYKPCGHEGDSITIPFTFLNASFTNKIKGKLLLHEWTKFRYGAFDEIGYEQDMLEPCYVFKKEAQFSSCAGTPLPSVGSVKSVCNANFLLQQEFILMKFLSNANSSIMSFPYLDNVAHFCTNSSHNRRAPTKQNLYCKRSVSEVVNSHSDFRNAQPTIRQSQPQLKILQRPKRLGKIQTAYAFVIDVSEEMRKEGKLQHVKQAISEFIQMLNFGTPVQLITFAEGEVIVNLEGSLANDDDKITFLQDIPDDSNNQQAPPQIQRVLIPVVDSVIASLASRTDFAWNILLFSDPQVGQTDMPQAIEKFRSTPHHISIFTFEFQSQEASDMWLSWYKLPNTKNVIVLPYCKISQYPSPCSVQTSIFITDHLVGLLNEQYDDPRFIQKVAEVVINNGGQAQFNIAGESRDIKSIYFFFPLPQNDPNSASKVILIPPSGPECQAQDLLEYQLVLTFPCDFQSGTWTLRLEGQVEPGIARLHLDAFVEYEEEANERLLVTSSLGQTDLTSELQPNSPTLTTIFIHLTTPQGNPVLDADVNIKIFYPSLLSTNGNGYEDAKMITLRDNGDDNNADQTRNDGIYSAFLVGYDKQWPSNHLGQVNIKSNGNTRILEEMETPKATFLRSQLGSKCCGKVIRSRSTRALKAPVQFQTLHLGFKTDGPWTNISGPPGFIGAITIESDDDSQVEIQFANVPGDVSDPLIKVGEVQACCVPTNENGDNPQLSPTELDCKSNSVECGEFVEPPGLQSCTISKQTLADLFITEEIFNSVVCGLRATSTGGVHGQISSDTFSTSLPAEVRQNGSSEPECDSISDGCLPIWIFWVMIGCIGLLLIIIVIILIIWACLSRSKKEKVKPKREELPRRQSSFDYPPPRKNTRRDSPVEYATVMVETPPPKKEEPKVVKELFVNHAYIQNEDGELKIIADNGKILRKPLSNDQQPPRRSEMREVPDNMPVFKPQPVPIPVPTTRSIGSRKRPQIVHQNPMLRSDSELQLNNSPQIIPITNGYASVSRAGRNRIEPTPPSPKLVTFDPHYMTPKQDKLPNNPVPTPPPPKVHPYPSSDSSSDSEDPRRPPKFTKPPRYPIGSKFVRPQFKPQSMSSAGSPPNHAPIPPPRSQPPQAPVRQPVMQFHRAEDVDSDEWDDGENYGVSYA